jgi:hypothetical protein
MVKRIIVEVMIQKNVKTETGRKRGKHKERKGEMVQRINGEILKQRKGRKGEID